MFNQGIQIFQSYLNYANIFGLIFLGGMGLIAAFSLKDSLLVALTLFFIVLFGSTFSKIVPGLTPGIANYIWSIIIGFTIGKAIKWSYSNIVGDTTRYI